MMVACPAPCDGDALPSCAFRRYTFRYGSK